MTRDHAAALATIRREVQHYRDKLKHRQTSAHNAPVATGFSFAEVPDWQLQQWDAALAAVADALTKGEGK